MGDPVAAKQEGCHERDEAGRSADQNGLGDRDASAGDQGAANDHEEGIPHGDQDRQLKTESALGPHLPTLWFLRRRCQPLCSLSPNPTLRPCL